MQDFVPAFFAKKIPGASSGLFFAIRTGLEPATSAVTGRHSNQLNYRIWIERHYAFLFCECKDRYSAGTDKFFYNFFEIIFRQVLNPVKKT